MHIHYINLKIHKSAAGTVRNQMKSSNYIKIPVQAGLTFIDLGLFSLHLFAALHTVIG